jgi:hypothetical protein
MATANAAPLIDEEVGAATLWVVTAPIAVSRTVEKPQGQRPMEGQTANSKSIEARTASNENVSTVAYTRGSKMRVRENATPMRTGGE